MKAKFKIDSNWNGKKKNEIGRKKCCLPQSEEEENRRSRRRATTTKHWHVWCILRACIEVHLPLVYVVWQPVYVYCVVYCIHNIDSKLGKQLQVIRYCIYDCMLEKPNNRDFHRLIMNRYEEKKNDNEWVPCTPIAYRVIHHHCATSCLSAHFVGSRCRPVIFEKLYARYIAFESPCYTFSLFLFDWYFYFSSVLDGSFYFVCVIVCILIEFLFRSCT